MNKKLFFILLAGVCLIGLWGYYLQTKLEPSDTGPFSSSPFPKANGNRATHHEVGQIGLAEPITFANLTTFCLTGQGNILACDAQTRQIRVISPNGELLADWQLEFAPYAICSTANDSIYVAGPDTVARLDTGGRVVNTISGDDNVLIQGRPAGITATDGDVFVAFASGSQLRPCIIRLGRDLTEPAVIASDLRVCCGRLNLAARDGVLYTAENGRHRIIKYDRDGNVLATWGSRDSHNIEGFGGCCNPMNLCFDVAGNLYTAESHIGRIKRYTPDGKFLNLVGITAGITPKLVSGRQVADCTDISIAVSKDGSCVYVLDFRNNIIRILKTEQSALASKAKAAVN